MKKLALWTTSALLFGLSASSVSAANKGNSIEFLRTMARGASTDADAAFFNPAGLAFIQHEGISFQLANQFIFIHDTIQDSGELLQKFHPDAYEVDIKTYLYPIAHLAYRRGSWAFFGSFYPISGGAGGRFADGFPTVDGGFLNMLQSQLGKVEEYSRKLVFEAVDYALAGSLGAAHRITDKIAVALGYRLTRKITTFNGEMSQIHIKAADWGDLDYLFPGTMDIEAEATGWCHAVIAGVHAQPTKKLNIGLKLEYSTPLEINTKNKKFALAEPGMNPDDPGVREFFKQFLDGYKEKYTEPPSVALGVSYQILPPLKVETGLYYQLNSLAASGGKEKDHVDAPWLGIGLEYALTPNLLVSVGYGYDQTGRKSTGQKDNDIWLSGHFISGGFAYRIIPALEISAGSSYSMALETHSASASVVEGIQTYNGGSVVVGLGVNGRL